MSIEAAFSSSNPFLRSLTAFVRRGTGADGDAAAVPISAAVSSHHGKPASLNCLSPEVLRRLRFVGNAAAAATTNGVQEAGPFRFGEDGRAQIQWSLVNIAETGGEGEEDALAEGARLAVACHVSLRRAYQRRQQQQAPLPLEETSKRLPRAAGLQSSTRATFELPSADALQGVIDRILGAESDAEEIYVGFCVCLIVLERALYDIYRQRAAKSSNKSDAPQHDSGGARTQGVGSEGVDVPLVAPAMILRDLIASPEVEAALPKQMLALLRLLLLPMGYNIRNLVWHGFLAPRELPRELASLVLLLTLSLPADSASNRWKTREADVEYAEEGAGLPPPPPPPPPQQQQPQQPPPPQPKTTPQADPPRSAWWALDSFDGRLACPRGLTSAVESLLSEQHREELEALLWRSAFVLPGREDVALLGLRAPGDARSGQRNDAFLLVALLPVLEHGLRCLFSCANGSPGHLFAHLRQYYSTLDGFGQRAKHQLLLDQTLSGCPDQKNLLLAALGPGLSAVLLDLFMMSAGPNLRGKVAHGEIDLAGVLPRLQPCSQAASLPPSSSFSTPDSGIVGSPDTVKLTAAVFLVLCRRYCPGTGVRPRPSGAEGIEHAGSSSSSSSSSSSGSNSVSRGSPPPPMFSDAFVRALDAADASCSEWVPRFHPHELLEADLQACRDEFDGLALALERRTVSVDTLPGGDLARMTVVVLGDGGHRCSGDTLPGTGNGEGKENKEASPPSTTRLGHGEGGRRQEESGEEEGEARGDGASSLPVNARLVLTVTDSASRLVPPRPPIATGGGALETPPKRKGQDTAATSGIFPGLNRVNEALGVHALSLTARFKRSAARSLHREETETPTPTPPSAFAAHYCCKRSPQADEALSCDDGLDAVAANDKVHRRSRRRISPPTNVVTASPLPQMSCVSGLCRGCAEVARGLRERLAELEALLAASSARSKQRRAYATLLRVAPALLRFLAAAVAAVELFVVEWDQRTAPPADEAAEQAAAGAAGPPDPAASASGLSFLRRLAAVNGTLCVTPAGESWAKVAVAAGPGGGGRSAASGKDDSGCGEGATGKKKGFAQALAELASFLETRTARQGFARCSC